MPSTILSDNGASSGTAGIKTTGSNDGILALQTTTTGGTATTALTIDTSQNVGIGTSSPSYKLHVSGSGTVTGAIASTSANAVLRITSSGGFDQIIEYTTVSTAGLAIKDATAGTNRMYINSSGNVGIGNTSPNGKLDVTSTSAGANTSTLFLNNLSSSANSATSLVFGVSTAPTTRNATIRAINNGSNEISLAFLTSAADAPAERMRIDSSGNVGIGTASPDYRLQIEGPGTGVTSRIGITNTTTGSTLEVGSDSNGGFIATGGAYGTLFYTNGSERARITSGGDFLVGKTSDTGNTAGITLGPSGYVRAVRSNELGLLINRLSSDGTLVSFEQDTVAEGSISVSGNTVSYNAFAGSHWSQLQQGRGYNPEIPRGTVMSTIGEMCEWKSVVWDEVIEHPAVPAVEAKEAVLDEEGNVIEPAVEAVEGKDAWTETFNKREAYLGNLAVGATFTEDGVTKTVVDDGNERLPKVKISDVVGDKAVYGVFQTYDEVQDMLVTSLGAFVVRIAAGVTVQIGDLLESNGDGCARVQDDDVIRSRTIGKVTSTTPSATYADGSYTVPAVLYCG
jgi:hypothetical protein